MKFIQSFALAIILLAATAILAHAQTINTRQPADSLMNKTIKVKGITCAMDLKMITANVEKLNGVSGFKAGKQGTTTSFELTYNPALVTLQEVYGAIENTGSCDNPDERPYKVKQQTD